MLEITIYAIYAIKFKISSLIPCYLSFLKLFVKCNSFSARINPNDRIHLSEEMDSFKPSCI